MPDPTTVPDKLSEEDRLRLKLSDERAGRLKAERLLLQQQLIRVSAETSTHVRDRQTLETEFAARYSLRPSDTVNADTGQIARVTEPQPTQPTPVPNDPAKELTPTPAASAV